MQKALERRRLLRRNRELEERLEGARAALETDRSARRRCDALLRTIESLRHNESHVLIQGESGTGKELVARAIHGRAAAAGGPSCPSTAARSRRRSSRASSSATSAARSRARSDAPGPLPHARTAARSSSTRSASCRSRCRPSCCARSRSARSGPSGGGRGAGRRARRRRDAPRPRRRWCETSRFRSRSLLPAERGAHRASAAARAPRGRPAAGAALPREAAPRRGRSSTASSRDALARLVRHDWPGNVRELENVIESALALAQGPVAASRRSADGPEPPRVPLVIARAAGQAGAETPVLGSLPLSLDAYERCALERALRSPAAMRPMRRVASGSVAAPSTASSASTACACPGWSTPLDGIDCRCPPNE